jgi:hypothetical protein
MRHYWGDFIIYTYQFAVEISMFTRQLVLYSGVRYSAVTDVKLLFCPGIDHAAGSCEDAIHYSSIQLAYQNVGNKSRRFSNKVKCLLAEGSKFFFVPFNGV